MSAYKHLSFEERAAVACLHADELSLHKIAQALGRSASINWCELRRNSNKDGS